MGDKRMVDNFYQANKKEQEARGPDTSDRIKVLKGSMRMEDGKVILSPGIFEVNGMGIAVGKETKYESIREIVEYAIAMEAKNEL